MVLKSEGCSLSKQNGPANEPVRLSGTKRPQPECLTNSPPQQIPIRNNGCYLVYVRRKPESKQHKSTMCNKPKDLPIKLCEEDENHEQIRIKNFSTVHIPKYIPEPETSSEGVCSALPSVTIDSGKSNMTSLVTESKCSELDHSKRLSVLHWEERFVQLQNFLKVMDQLTQDDYRQMLCSLSSADLSRLAVELERRAIQLSAEEAKEIQRAKVLDIHGIPESKK